jgi:hypothetical protein
MKPLTFEERMAARRKREESQSIPEETEEQRQAKLSDAYMKRTGRKSMTSSGSGKDPRLVELNPVTGEELEEGCYMMAHNTPDGLCDPITGCPGCAQERRRRAMEGK